LKTTNDAPSLTVSLACPSYNLRADQLGYLELLLNRSLAPLTGYLGRADFDSVLAGMRLGDGRLMPWPISLDVPARLGEALAPGDRLALRDAEGFMLAVLDVSEIWPSAPAAEARALFGAADPAVHPGAAAYLAATQAVRLAGEVTGLALPPHVDFPDLRLTPAALRAQFAQDGWGAVLACPVAGIPLLADQAVIRQAAASCGARILVTRPVGDALTDGAAHFAGVRCARHFTAAFAGATARLVLLPLPQPGAGPRQALFEALIHGNLGASRSLVAPDQNDPGAAAGRLFYPCGAAQALIAAHAAETGVAMVAADPLAVLADARRRAPHGLVASDDGAGRPDAAGLLRCLDRGLPAPEGCALPEIVAELRAIYPPRARQGLILFMTGLSGAGKSTLAKHLYVLFMERRARTATLLDGDIVRRRLSSELTFTKEHRNLHIARLGYVASEIARNGGVAICAPIAPYAAARRAARALACGCGGFVEIHVSTPLAVCEQRDPKGLYARARAGLVHGFTGIDDPYEVPEQSELTLDMSVISPDEAAQRVLRHLAEEGYLG